MSRLHFALVLALGLAAPRGADASLHSQQRLQMGTLVQISVWHGDSAIADAAIEAGFAEITRIEQLLSEWIPTSELSRVNADGSNRPVPVGLDTYSVLERGLQVGELSGGAFDVSWAALRDVWDFAADPPALPEPNTLAGAVKRIDFRSVRLQPSPRTVHLLRPGMALGLGGIAKGYAVDRAIAAMKALGVTHALVSGGGDVAIRGRRGDRSWKVGIQHPRGRQGELLAVIEAHDEAVVTSGDYERFMTVDGRRYHHIIDPRTGMPARGLMSVTVIAQSAMDADAFSTAAFVMGPKRGLRLLESQDGVEGVLVDASGAIRLTSGARSRVNLRVESVVTP